MLPIIVLNIMVVLMKVSGKCLFKNEKYHSGNNTDTVAALKFLDDSTQISVRHLNRVMNAVWDYETNLTEQNRQEISRVQEIGTDFSKELWKVATTFDWKKFKGKNETAYRHFQKISRLGAAALPEEKFQALNDVLGEMVDIHTTAKVCNYKIPNLKPCNLSLNPDVIKIMKTSENYDELKYYWVQYRNETGRNLRKKFPKYVDLSNEAACLNGFNDAGEEWREEFEDDDDILDEFNQLWQDIKPLYEQLHAYVRRKLIKKYSSKYIKSDGPIPAHLLGEVMASFWGNIYYLVEPYPQINAVHTMVQKNITVLDMFKIAEEFFTSLGLIKMPPLFWNRSIFEKPTDREIICHPASFNFFINEDVRIKICATVTMGNFIIIHHEMGHIEYYLHYANQPLVFQEGTNSGFHEAIGDVIALSVSTPEHLKKIGLLEETYDNGETEINGLMQMALIKLVIIPFAYVVDLWRWKVFDGSIDSTELNTQWWNYRLKYQGLCPPTVRTEEDLDAGALYHIAANTPYIRYFISYVIQFQFHKALCDEAGYKGPLHKCDIYQSKKAGKLLSNMLKLGKSVSWREAMKIITKGKKDRMDASALLEYFHPLYNWLTQQNKNSFIGWKSDNPMICP